MAYSIGFGRCSGRTNPPMGEFGLIEQFFRDACPKANALDHPLALGIGDDAAILAPVPPGHQVVMTTDTLVEGRHYWPDVDPQALGHKVLAVNLSDLAAMGAEPWAFTLSVSVRTLRTDWLAAFMKGMSELASRFRIDLVGGDTVGLGTDPYNAESFSVTALGLVPQGQALRRDGLMPGDRIWVSGDLGDGEWAVRAHTPARKLLWPEPRVSLGLALRGIAHAAIDVSDGLSSELAHLVIESRRRSGLYQQVQAVLPALSSCLGSLPQAAIAAGQLDIHQACQNAASSGDEYELVFAAPESATAAIAEISTRLSLALTPIGRVRDCSSHDPRTDSDPVVWCDHEGRPVSSDQRPRCGFDHFAAQT